MLFINADREFREGRAQNFLQPEHIEKIVSAYRAFDDIPSFARVISRAELAENEDNLNIRRYVDTAPPPEPQDVVAHLHGGIPKTEVDAHAHTLGAHGLDTSHLLADMTDSYLRFRESIETRSQIKEVIESDTGVVTAEGELVDAIDQWWKLSQSRFDTLTIVGLVELRRELLQTFHTALPSTSMLDRFTVNGIIASWWGVTQTDLKVLANLGYAGLIEAWTTTVLDALEGEGATTVNPLDHKVAVALLPEYLDGLATLKGQVAEMESTIRAATSSDDEDSDEDVETALSEVEIMKSRGIHCCQETSQVQQGGLCEASLRCIRSH